MKVSLEKYSAIKKAKGSIAKVGAKFGVSDTTVRRIRGSLNYEAYKGGMAKPKKSLTNAKASGKKKAGSSSSTTKPKTSDKSKSILNKDNSKNDNIGMIKGQGLVDRLTGRITVYSDGNADVVTDIGKKTLRSEYNELSDKYDAVVRRYVKKSEELDSLKRLLKIGSGVGVVVLIALIIAIIL